ncbi:DUF6443 domain-containing protein [Flavobacterium humi]|uniref:RHS repeat-associated core domain-containing protein n=1 Tax=Flavobacterium humi TaxID=2562683 RepID=A0A4Z0L4D2_9FLAO|nr:DUF6443 domain-containing protein [Flavobacterium humi]TGD56537.1 RHS repeat-associated core domain-containing protein [Flavobacterium humi]
MKKILILLLLPFAALAQTTTQNYIKTTTYKDSTATASVVQMTYFDGLGRPIQQIANGQSATGKDIVTHMEYDTYGRQPKEFLPYANTAASLNYNPSALTETNSFYNSAAYENTTNPYSEKVFEASPLNRVLEQGAPGEAWGVANTTKHTIRMDYQANATADAVKLFTVSDSWNASKGTYENTLSQNGNYAQGELYKTITKDENWTSGNNNTIQEFKDKEGRVVLKRTFNQSTAHDTYYIYDAFGNLACVLPPLAEGAITQTILDGLCYQYKYDSRNRLAAKKLPGKQWEYMVYDLLDRPVATGPALSPFGDGTIGMAITDYDAFGRVTQTGWKVMTVTESNRNTWQGNINAGTNPFTLGTYDVLSKNYYDNYSFPDAPSVPATIEGQKVSATAKGLPTGTWLRLVYTPTTLYGATSSTLYDTKYRPIRTHAETPMVGYTRTDSKLDFTGKTLYTKTYHKRTSADPEIIITDNFTYSAQDRLVLHTQQIGAGAVQLIAKNTYDELGQLTSKNVGGTDATGALGLQKADYTYNIRGWLKSINDVTNLTQGTNPVDLFAFKVNYQDNDNQSYGVYGVPHLYNGNISETFWRTNSDNVQRKYGYNYDNLNRLTNATYQKPGAASPTTNSYNETLAYDKNGNITALTRTGEYDDADYSLEVDNLAYTYHADNKNQLMKVFDSTNNTNGFKDDSTGTSDPADDYSYDANGNMTADTNKGITQIVYNHMNLPIKIVFNNNSSTKIEYLYNAAGVKLQKNVTQGSTVTATQYFNGFQYVDGVLQFFSHDEGYVNNTVVNGNNVYNYVFNYTDHLGNVRLSYGVDPATGVLKVLEENNYYPFGLKHKNYNMSQKTYIKDGGKVVLEPCSGCAKTYQYKYNGKELQDELGLNVYDYDNRAYDPATGRFIQMDPKGELGRRWSSYNYCFDNPIYFQDPDGMWPWPSWNSVKSFVKSYATGSWKAAGNMVVGVASSNPVSVMSRGVGEAKKIVTAYKRGGASAAAEQYVNSVYETSGAKGIVENAKAAASGNPEAMGGLVTNLGAIVVAHKAGTSKVSATAVAETTSAETTTTLYRGVNTTSPAFENATQGTAVPRGGTATAAEHNAGNTNSEFTSWSTNPEVAKNFALRTSGEGVIMETTVPTSSTVASPSVKNVNLIQGGGVVNESEVLLKGNVSGATVTPVNR